MTKEIFQQTIPNLIKSLFVTAFCLIGFIFEFLVELPFLLILELSERLGKKSHQRPDDM